MYGHLTLRQKSDGTLLARIRDPETGEQLAAQDWAYEDIGRTTDTQMRELVDAWLAGTDWMLEPDQLDLLPDGEPRLVVGPDVRA